ncbi:MAG: hypothetical protein WBN39_08535 [Flavobacteriaceae bacterium]
MNLPTDYYAGDAIRLRFKSNPKIEARLLLTNAFSTSVVEPKVLDSVFEFEIPKNYREIAGICQWQLISQQRVSLSGQLQIYPNTRQKSEIESYLGPRSITAGNIDFSMYVTVPTDVHDNPLTKGTKLLVKHQFENGLALDSVEIKNLIAWSKISATERSGRILVSSSMAGATSQEFTAMVYPTKATDFTIAFSRNHPFADGNQTIVFKTSTLKDLYGNILSDGTLVNFRVRDAMGMLLLTTGISLNGIAEAKLLHPTHRENWKVTAYIAGAAKSNELAITFEAAVTDFDIKWDQNTRYLSVGPVKSFMDQMIPDGLPVQLEVYNASGQFIETMMTNSNRGFGHFTLPPDFFEAGKYQLKIEAAGITKSIDVNLK